MEFLEGMYGNDNREMPQRAAKTMFLWLKLRLQMPKMCRNLKDHKENWTVHERETATVSPGWSP